MSKIPYVRSPREEAYCPECDDEERYGKAALNFHYYARHGAGGKPVRLGMRPGRLPSSAEAYRDALAALKPFAGGDGDEFHGAPVVPGSHGWGELGAAAGIGQGLPQARYVVWSYDTPIAWYLDDSTDKGWVFPEGDYYKYSRATSGHQGKIRAALALLPEGGRT